MDNSSISYVHPKAFVDLPKLCYLHLNNNNIKRLDPGIFEGLSNLHYLYLQNNQIAFVPRGLFSDLLSVRYLTLQRNRLSILGSGTFLGMRNLQTLNLANNKISRISNAAFCHLENLVYLLSLSHNPIRSIQRFAFKGLNKLRYLSLKSVKLKHIAVNGFFGLSNLSQLILSYNDLENINSSSFTSLNSLKYLQLDRNKITKLQSKVLEPLVSLTHLHVNYNPWNCSCKMFGLLKWLASSPISVKILCRNPLSMRGRSLHYIRWTQFANCSSLTASPEAAWNVESADTHHSPTTLLMAWHKGNRHSPFEEFVKADTKFIALWEGTAATSASPLPHRGNTAAGTQSQGPTGLSVLPVQISAQIIPVTGTIEVKSLFPTDAAPVSLQTTALCTQQVEKLNQAFDVLLAFFVLACAVILFLTYKIIHFRQKLKVLENSGEKRIEYYGFYQPGRYNINDAVQSLTENSMGDSEMDQIRLLKRTASESQAQVILFEHSSL
ncbi:hypothetical protein CIB84_003651 [Bambusicola thoracicus]|uniref:LRRCT domain-containing protein n=1 Tax=Bambusicola thoracicus TaxID=9083 RepID=A0A2P4T8B9_BAMTH|nr:hypothetical protein CIB84_003651 [Bambusicola thoracicus]